MSSPVRLRVVFDGDDARKLTLMTGIPASVDQLIREIKTVFGLKQQFRLQHMQTLEMNMSTLCQPVKLETGIL